MNNPFGVDEFVWHHMYHHRDIERCSRIGCRRFVRHVLLRYQKMKA